jgi:hypothetical protein
MGSATGVCVWSSGLFTFSFTVHTDQQIVSASFRHRICFDLRNPLEIISIYYRAQGEEAEKRATSN